MDFLKKGWFSELSTLWPGQCFSLEVEEVIYHEKSQYQDILVLKTRSYGRVLVLDGVIQCTERDEFSYQEMMAHVPVTCHPAPTNVLVVGGGDGGVARELIKHSAIESIHLCEIDPAVISAVCQHMPFMPAGCFSSDKLHVHNADGREYLLEHAAQFDVIITDSSDPVGPASSLFEEEYYERISKALRSGGVMCCQGENMWLHQDLIHQVMTACRKYFRTVAYGYVSVPTYPAGQIGLLLASKDQHVDFSRPCKQLSQTEMNEMSLRYYSPEIHTAAFTLPRFARDAFSQ